MPSRGNYWQKGGLPDETVKEEDLSQALQAKVNSGGAGVQELLKTINVPSDTISTTITLDTPVNFADYAEFSLVIHGHHRANTASMGVRINGNSGSVYSYDGRESLDSGAGSDVLNGNDNIWRLPSALVEIDSEYYMKLTLSGGAILQATGSSGGDQNPQRVGTGELSYAKEDTVDTFAVSRGGIKIFSFSDTTLVSFTLLDRNNTNSVVGAGTVLSVFGKKIV